MVWNVVSKIFKDKRKFLGLWKCSLLLFEVIYSSLKRLGLVVGGGSVEWSELV